MFKDLKSVEIPTLMGWCVIWWWVDRWGDWWDLITKNQIDLNHDLIKIIQICLKIYDLLRHPHLWVGGWVDWWVNGWDYVISLKSNNF